jgi:hypothetical protein
MFTGISDFPWPRVLLRNELKIATTTWQHFTRVFQRDEVNKAKIYSAQHRGNSLRPVVEICHGVRSCARWQNAPATSKESLHYGSSSSTK